MSDTLHASRLDSPCGPLELLVDRSGAVVRLRFAAAGEPPTRQLDGRPVIADEEGRGERARRQLGEYFAGERRAFELALAPAGTEFQREVWKAVATIPFGATRSYGEVARAIGRPGASRAVGAANGANPIPIVVPCHRVVGADGSLVGYGGGLHRKRVLLGLEGRAETPLFAAG